MEVFMATVLLGVGVAVATVLVVAAVFDRLNHRSFLEDALRARAEDAPPPAGPISAADLARLPAPVKRYLELAGVVGKPRYRFAHITHGGFFRPSPKGPWFPIQGEYYLTTGKPTFVWYGKIRMPLGISVVARDSCIGGRGRMLIKLASAIVVGDSTGPETDQSARGRLVSELSMVPTSLVPSDHVRWEPIDERGARMVVRAGASEEAAVLQFGDNGMPTRIVVQRSYEDRGKTPWTGTVKAYREFQGLNVCEEIEGAWNLPEGDYCYVRFRVTGAQYE
jgi:hypothetical protein